MNLGTFVGCTPQQVIDQLAGYLLKGDFNIFGAGTHFGTMGHQQTLANTEMFAKNTLPGGQASPARPLNRPSLPHNSRPSDRRAANVGTRG